MKVKKTIIFIFLLLMLGIIVQGIESVKFIDNTGLEYGIPKLEGKPLFVSYPYYLEVAESEVEGLGYIHKFGNNPDIDTASGFEDIWNGGGHYTGQDPTSQERVEIFSDNINDNGITNLTGGHTIRIRGLDENYTQIEEILTLDGTTPVLSNLSYLRLYRARILTAGNSSWNEGIITIRQSVTTANIFVVMPAEEGSTLIAAFTTPANTNSFMTAWYGALSGKKAGFSTIKLVHRHEGGAWQTLEVLALSSAGSGIFTREYTIPKNDIPEKTDVKIRADSSANDLGVSGGFDLIIIDETTEDQTRWLR